MKTDFLEGLGLSKDVIDKVMAENGKDIASEQAKTAEKDGKLSALETERDSLKGQLAAANGQIEKFKGTEMDLESVRKEAGEWKEKAAAAEKEAADKLDAQAYEFNAREYLGKYQFASGLARDAAFSKFLEQKFQRKEGTFLGADAYMETLKASDPGAFSDGNPVPEIVRPGNAPAERKDTSKMTYSEMIAHLKENPNASI